MKVIRTESDYESAMGTIDLFLARHPEAGTANADELEVLTVLVEEYERRTTDIGLPDPISAIEFRMEQQGLRQKDLVPYLGSRSKVSEVLSGKRTLTLNMIRALHSGLGIPAEVLLQGRYPDGDPHRIRRTGPEDYEMSVALPLDSEGMLGRECPDPTCSPAYFKIKPGTGVMGTQTEAYCPYCRCEADPSDFHTREQVRYAVDTAKDEALKGVDRMVRDALALGSSGRKKLGGDFISMELQYKPGQRPTIRRPIEEELRRDMHCAHCGLDHAVFGLATWCPDCGGDMFLQHVEAEFGVVHMILADIPARLERLGPRVAAKDTENALEDVVSIFEAALKIITRRHLLDTGSSAAEVDAIFRKRVKNRYQNVEFADATFRELTGRQLFASTDDGDRVELASVFAKRHPITHNLGMVDRRYLAKASSGELEGREVRVTPEEVEDAATKAFAVLRDAYIGGLDRTPAMP